MNRKGIKRGNRRWGGVRRRTKVEGKRKENNGASEWKGEKGGE